MRGRDPLGWDPMRTVSFRTHMAISFTHNRLFRYKAGPEVEIGTMIVEPDLVERWEEPRDTRYIFHLRRGVHWQHMGVVNLPSGQPTLDLTGGAALRLEELTPSGMKARIDVTITDDYPLAQAIVIISAIPSGHD